MSRARMCLLLIGLLALFTYYQRHILQTYPTAMGWEYERIAQSLATGHGFSFPPKRGRLLYTPDDPVWHTYGVTAWKEPVYPYVMALAFRTLGETRGRLAILLGQLVLLLSVCLMVYVLGARLFGPAAGIGGAFMASIDLHTQAGEYLQPPIASALLLLVGLWLLLWYADAPSRRRALLLGVYLGASALVHVVVATLAGVAILVMLVPRPRLWTAPLVMLLAFAATIAPWTIRNYVQFGYLIPVQTGFGQFTNLANAYLLETYRPEVDACGDGSPPAFRSTGPLDAMYHLQRDVESPIMERAERCVEARIGRDAYQRLNEHERDLLHQRQLAEFIRQHPTEFLTLTIAKSFAYFYRGRRSIPTVLGLVGMVVFFRRRHGCIFLLAVLGYAAPFIVGGPLYVRYRLPLEPVFVVFACGLISYAVQAGWQRKRLRSAEDQPEGVVS